MDTRTFCPVSTAQPRFITPPSQDAMERGRLILRDGTSAQIRPVCLADRAAVAYFFRGLSIESLRRRFFSPTPPAPELIERLVSADNADGDLSLIVLRQSNGMPQVIAVGSYFSRDSSTAEVAVAVADAYLGKGLGTLLLERLAAIAATHGFSTFTTTMAIDDAPMHEVLRLSGFTLKEQPEKGEIEIEIDIAATAASVAGLETRDRAATVASLAPFFKPRGVAVIGASRQLATVGRCIFDGLLAASFTGPVYPINSQATELAGRKCYSNVRDVPDPVDLAIIAVPAAAVLGVVDDCAARGIRALVVLAAGFAETGRAGSELQKVLVERVRGHGMRRVGPNCLGLLNTDPAVRLNASFAPVFPPPGRIAMSSQSGAVGVAALHAAKRFGLGLSTFISVGNKADVSGNDLLQYWEDDPATDVILLYLESFGNPRRFSRIARRVGRTKPVVVLQSGLTRAGGRAAGSHTAALATNAAAVEALFRQTGIIRAASLEEMFDLALFLGDQPLPAGRRVGIVTNSGGPAILCTDACEAADLTVLELSIDLREKLTSLFPAGASIGNPIDLGAGAEPEAYRRCLEAVLVSGEVDALIAIFTPVGLAETKDVTRGIAEGLAAARRAGLTAPVLTCLIDPRIERSHLELTNERVPCFPFPEVPARVLGKAAAYRAWQNRPQGTFPDFEGLDIRAARKICRSALAEGAGWLSARDAQAVLTAMGLRVVPSVVARTMDEAVAAAGQLGFPVAVKLASRKVIHKTEAGGVRLNLTDADQVRTACREILGAVMTHSEAGAMEGLIVQPMLFGGIEVMAGITHDPLFGPLVACGFGGIFVEILADVQFRVAPLTDRDASEMLRDLRGFRLLEGYRNHPPADIAAIEEALLRLSRLAEELPEIDEIDLNPIFAFSPGAGCQIADARIHVRRL
ncbi:MAG TPA: GNAT family N-acetyltransferase [Urbifossiella sp.]|nr:GNAT family N-acetyltransferase [Urbifossiella sp.]